MPAMISGGRGWWWGLGGATPIKGIVPGSSLMVVDEGRVTDKEDDDDVEVGHAPIKPEEWKNKRNIIVHMQCLWKAKKI